MRMHQRLVLLNKSRLRGFFIILALLFAIGTLAQAAAFAQQQPEITDLPEPLFPPEPYENYSPPIPNYKLNFKDDCNRSCCAKDYSDKDPLHYMKKPDYDKDMSVSPFYLDRRDQATITPCERMSMLSPLRMDASIPAQPQTLPRIDIKSDSSRQSMTPYALIQNRQGANDKFHVATGGGRITAQLANVSYYSICAGRGENTVIVKNTDNGGIHTYGGNNHIILAGNNTNQFTRAGHNGGNVIEIEHAVPISRPDKASFRNEQWSSNSVFRTGLSGGNGDDTVVLKNLPTGSKWCHIGDYELFGEQFHVVEFALPPSVVEGPRRQRINFGTSIDYVVVFGQKMTLIEFLENKPSNSKLCQPERPMPVAPKPPPPPVKKKVIRGYW